MALRAFSFWYQAAIAVTLSFFGRYLTGLGFGPRHRPAFVLGELQRRGVIANVQSHLLGERLSIGHVNRYLTDGVVAIAELRPAVD